MELDDIMKQLEAVGTERTKAIYMRHGGHEPLFGVTIASMKPIAKRIGKDQRMAEALYATGNYDAMYLAGMVAEPRAMTEADFERWIDQAYFYMVSDYIVAVTLAETAFAQVVADRWIADGRELRASAGWSCYAWLLGSRPDSEFDTDKLRSMLDNVARTIHDQPNRVKYSMNNFAMAVGVSYLPLYEEAVRVAAQVGPVDVKLGKTKCKVPLASEAIRKAADGGRLGFKRRNVRC
jgi:3-methyladenine DNA glycosylase AlkD